MNRQVYQLIEAKRLWHHAINKNEQQRGFRGWHSRGYLPHFDVPGAQQFVTWRLADSLPESRRGEWQHLLAIEDEQEKQIQLEKYLDRGCGECVLRQPEIAAMVEETMLYDDGRRCTLLAWVIMPNHVHLLVEIGETPLSKLLQSWKTLTSKRANVLLNRTGHLWQADYRDRYIRDEEHHRKTLQYIESNPVKAGLVKAPADRAFRSARFRVQKSAFEKPHLNRSADAHVCENSEKARNGLRESEETRGRGRPRSELP